MKRGYRACLVGLEDRCTPVYAGPVGQRAGTNMRCRRRADWATSCRARRNRDRYPLDRRVVAEIGLSIICVSTPIPR